MLIDQLVLYLIVKIQLGCTIQEKWYYISSGRYWGVLWRRRIQITTAISTSKCEWSETLSLVTVEDHRESQGHGFHVSWTPPPPVSAFATSLGLYVEKDLVTEKLTIGDNFFGFSVKNYHPYHLNGRNLSNCLDTFDVFSHFTEQEGAVCSGVWDVALLGHFKPNNQKY